MTLNINFISLVSLALIFLNGCGDNEIKARELGFINSREMRALQAAGFSTKDEYAKHSGFSGLDEMKDAEARYIGKASKYYEYLKTQKEIQVTRPENERLDVLLSDLERINKINKLINNDTFQNKSDRNIMMEKLVELNKNIENSAPGMKFSGMQCMVHGYSKKNIICTINNIDPEVMVKINLRNSEGLFKYAKGEDIIFSGKIMSVKASYPMVIDVESNKISKNNF